MGDNFNKSVNCFIRVSSRIKNIMAKQKYNFKTGLWKSLKNTLVVFVPAMLAFLANVPVEYTPFAGFLVYLIKNYIQNK